MQIIIVGDINTYGNVVVNIHIKQNNDGFEDKLRVLEYSRALVFDHNILCYVNDDNEYVITAITNNKDMIQKQGEEKIEIVAAECSPIHVEKSYYMFLLLSKNYNWSMYFNALVRRSQVSGEDSSQPAIQIHVHVVESKVEFTCQEYMIKDSPIHSYDYYEKYMVNRIRPKHEMIPIYSLPESKFAYIDTVDRIYSEERFGILKKFWMYKYGMCINGADNAIAHIKYLSNDKRYAYPLVGTLS